MNGPGATPTQSTGLADEWNPRTVVLLMLTYWKGLLSISALGAALGLGLSCLITPTYRAEAVLVPSEELPSSQAGAMGGQLGALGALAGINPLDDRKLEALATLRSRALTESYIRENNLLPILFSSRWDNEKNQWKESIFVKVPTVQDGFRRFDRKLRTITEEKKAGVIKISIEWKDATLASKWTRDLVDLANVRLRDQAIARSNRNLQYLNEQLDKISVVELRAALYKLIETEIKRSMVAQGSSEYAFRFVDPPEPPLKKAAPNHLLYALGGLFIGLLLYLGRLYWLALADAD